MILKLKNISKNFPIILIISSFGIYIFSYPIRLEHAVVYSGFFLYILFALPLRRIPFSFDFSSLILIFTLFFTYSLFLGVLMGNSILDSYVLGQIDRFLMPILILIMMGMIIGKKDLNLEEIWSKIQNYLIFGCVVSSMIIFYQAFIEPPTWLNLFLMGDVDYKGREILAERAYNMGRSTGIFSSPFEAGLFLANGLIISAYFLIKKKFNIFSICFFLIIFFGGILTTSKAFIVGIFLSFFLLLWLSKKKKVFVKLTVLLLIASIILSFLYKPLSENWRGFDMLNKFLSINSDTDILKLFSGNRYSYNDEGTLSLRFKQNSVFGNGFGNYGTVDSAFLEVWRIGGIFGIVFLIYVLGYVVLKGWNNRNLLEGKLLFILGVLFTLSSLGAPAITKNRVSVVLFVTICILISLIKQKYIKKDILP